MLNSGMVWVLQRKPGHLYGIRWHDVFRLVACFSCLFGDVPTQITVLKHDRVIGNAKPDA